jgi:hypothetical protein
MMDGRDDLDQALEHIVYLPRSAHRVTVLEALPKSIPDPRRPRTGDDPGALQALTGASEATISRTLSGHDSQGGFPSSPRGPGRVCGRAGGHGGYEAAST